jgi:hypothetical protein
MKVEDCSRRFEWTIPSVFILLGYFYTLVHGFNMADESWFLQVVHRVLEGQVLYRDINFGATPLSVYFSEGFLRIFSLEAAALKGFVTLCFGGTLFFSCRILRQLKLSGRFPFFFALALALYAPPPSAAPYQILANFFYLACFSSLIAWRDGKRAFPSRTGFL